MRLVHQCNNLQGQGMVPTTSKQVVTSSSSSVWPMHISYGRFKCAKKFNLFPPPFLITHFLRFSDVQLYCTRTAFLAIKQGTRCPEGRWGPSRRGSVLLAPPAHQDSTILFLQQPLAKKYKYLFDGRKAAWMYARIRFSVDGVDPCQILARFAFVALGYVSFFCASYLLLAVVFGALQCSSKVGTHGHSCP